MRRRPRSWFSLVTLMLLASACRADIGLDAAGATDDAGDMVIAIVGDAGERNDDTLAVASLVASTAASAVFTVGDNEYTTEGRTVGAYEESVGEVYGRWVDDGAFFPIPGDHDYGDRCDDPDEPADLDAYLEYFDLPLGPEDETYYDVRIGDDQPTRAVLQDLTPAPAEVKREIRIEG